MSNNILVGSHSSSSNPATVPTTQTLIEQPHLANDRKRKRESTNLSAAISPQSKLPYEHFKSATELSSPVSKQEYQKRRLTQKNLFSRSVVNIESNERCPATIIFKNSLHVVKGLAGKGSDSEVYRTTAIYLDGLPEQKVVKCSRRLRFEQEKRLLDETTGAPGAQNLDRIEQIGKEFEGQHHFAVFQASQGDITKLKYQNMERPIRFITKYLVNLASGIKALHDKNLIHRDIKGGNLLYNENGEAKVTDTGMLRKAPNLGEIHSVGCTPHYAPSFIWKSILDQRVINEGKIFSRGHQSKAGDVFSFGVTMQRDVIDKVINDIGATHGIKIENKYKKVPGPFTDEQMVEQEKEAPGQRIVYVFPNREKKIEESLLIYPPIESVKQKTLEAITKLEPHRSKEEIQALRALSDLANDLQQKEEKDVPPIEVVIETLNKIAQIFE